MPDSTRAHKKGPSKLGSDQTGTKKVIASTIAAPRLADKIQPPRGC